LFGIDSIRLKKTIQYLKENSGSDGVGKLVIPRLVGSNFYNLFRLFPNTIFDRLMINTITEFDDSNTEYGLIYITF